MPDYYTQFAFAVRATADDAARFEQVMTFLGDIEDRDGDGPLYSAEDIAAGLPELIASRFPRCPRASAEVPERLRPITGLLSCFEDWQDLQPGIKWRHDPVADQLIISDDADSPQLFATCELVLHLFPASLPVAFEYACTASRRVLDGFGGGAVLITSDGVDEVHTSSVLEDLCKKRNVHPSRAGAHYQMVAGAA